MPAMLGGDGDLKQRGRLLSLSRHRDSRMIDLTAHRPARTNQILEEIATYIGCYKPKQILRVAVDGVDGVGKTTFADRLGRAVELIGRPVIRSSVDDIVHCFGSNDEGVANSGELPLLAATGSRWWQCFSEP